MAQWSAAKRGVAFLGLAFAMLLVTYGLFLAFGVDGHSRDVPGWYGGATTVSLLATAVFALIGVAMLLESASDAYVARRRRHRDRTSA